MNNKFIVIEGSDTTGKTTLARSLAESLNGVYYKTPGYVSQKDMDKLDLEGVSTEDRFNFYFEGCKRDLERIKEIISNGSSVVCDRFIDTTISAHKAMGNVDTREAEKFSITTPRIQILLQATQSTIQKRLSERENVTRFELDQELMLRTSEEFLLRNNDLLLNTSILSKEETLFAALEFINSL